MEAQMSVDPLTKVERPQLLFRFKNGYTASLIVRDLGDAMLAFWPTGHKDMLEHVGTELTDDEVAFALNDIKLRTPHLAGKMEQAADAFPKLKSAGVRGARKAGQAELRGPPPKKRTHRYRLTYDPAKPN